VPLEFTPKGSYSIGVTQTKKVELRAGRVIKVPSKNSEKVLKFIQKMCDRDLWEMGLGTLEKARSQGAW
jgi:hypothetical protein